MTKTTPKDSAAKFMSERGFSVESVDVFDLKIHPDDGRWSPLAAWIVCALVVLAIAAIIWIA